MKIIILSVLLLVCHVNAKGRKLNPEDREREVEHRRESENTQQWQCNQLVSSLPEDQQQEGGAICDQINDLLDGGSYQDLDQAEKREFHRLRNLLKEKMSSQERPSHERPNEERPNQERPNQEKPNQERPDSRSREEMPEREDMEMDHCQKMVERLNKEDKDDARQICRQIENVLQGRGVRDLNATEEEEYKRKMEEIRDMIPEKEQPGKPPKHDRKPLTDEDIMRRCQRLVDDIIEVKQEESFDLCVRMYNLTRDGMSRELTQEEHDEIKDLRMRLKNVESKGEKFDRERPTKRQRDARFDAIVRNLPADQQSEARRLHRLLNELKNDDKMTEAERVLQRSYSEQLSGILGVLRNGNRRDPPKKKGSESREN